MACGKKMIATNIRGCRDIVVDETVGELVEVGDYKATAKAIEEQYLYGDNEFIISKEIGALKQLSTQTRNRKLNKSAFWRKRLIKLFGKSLLLQKPPIF